MDKKYILVLAIIIINIPFFIGVMYLIEKAFDKSRESQNNSGQYSATGYSITGVLPLSSSDFN